MPSPRNTRIRPKDTSRVEARRRYRDQQRASGVEPVLGEAASAVADEAPQGGSSFGLPDFRADIAALPRVLTSRWMWIPFAMLLAAFVLVLLLDADTIPAGTPTDLAGLYISLTLPPTSLFVFFIGGFIAPRASYLVGAILGAVDALLYTLLFAITPTVFDSAELEQASLTQQDTALTLDALLPLWGIAILVGILAASFAAWYRRFLRSSQERAKANRALREQEQAQKAKEKARADRTAARESRKAR